MTERVRPKKALGQHFLTHAPTAVRIVSALDAADADVVLEIGPGMGILTRHLTEQFGPRLRMVEIDPESVEYLGQRFPDFTGQILTADFLAMDLREITPGKIAVIGNFPYNISSQILFHLLDYRGQVTEIVGMFQREVARRIASGPGSREYGILSVLMGAFYDIRYLFTVSEKMFRPPPKVMSGVLRFTRKPVDPPGCEPDVFFRIVKAAFNQRRKTLRNALSAWWGPELEATGLGQMRAEQIGVGDFCRLALIARA